MDRHTSIEPTEGDRTLDRRTYFGLMTQVIGNSTNPRDVWDSALPLLAAAFEADAGLGFDRLSETRLQVASTHRWPGTMDHAPMPIAPDSQAAYILQSNRPVICTDFAHETRFLPAAPITRLGYSSSMSARLEMPSGVMGLVGVYSRQRNRFDPRAADDFAALVSMLSVGLHQARRLSKVEHQASHDLLTGLLSRMAVLKRLEDELKTGTPTGVIMLDLDGFKSVNDQHGHPAGDRVLEVIAGRLQAAAGPGADVGRLGGDEFLIVVSSADLISLRLRAEQLIGTCELLVSLETGEVDVSASVGLAISGRGDTSDSIIQRADRAMYRAKREGRGQVRIAAGDLEAQTETDDDASAVPARTSTIELLDAAIAGVRAFLQPIVDRHGTIIGVEALARGPAGDPLEAPDTLFETATTFGRLPELELAAKQAAFAAGVPHHLRLFVNLEPAAFNDPAWLHLLADAWLDGGSHPQVTVELTERALVASPGRLLRAIEHCRSLGWQIAIDDIGARSDSLAALRLLKPDVVKLDISLIQGHDTNHATRIATAVAAYCDRRQADVVAEGIETPEQQNVAEVLGANLFQGYLFGRPGPAPLTTTVTGDDAQTQADTRAPARRTDSGRPNPTERVAAKQQLLAISRHLEAEAASSDCVLLASLQHADFYTLRTRRQYEALARRCGFVGVIGQQLSPGTRNGVRVAGVAPDDPFARRWWVVMVSSHASLALLAEEVEPRSVEVADADRLFRYRLITDPDRVENVAIELFERF